MQSDGPFKKASCGCEISLGTQQKINGVAVAVDRLVQILPLACDLM